MLSRERKEKIILEATRPLCLDNGTSLCAHTNSLNKYLLTSTFQALLKAPEGLKMEGHQLSFDVDYSVTLETDMQNILFFLQYSKLPPRRYLQKTVRTWVMEGTSAWRNRGKQHHE